MIGHEVTMTSFHLAPLIQDLALILVVAGLMSLIFHRIHQPVVLGYILAGMIVGPHTPPFQFVTDIPSIRTWAELGVIFLMFSLGLEFSFRKLARVGASAVITASTEALFFLPAGYIVGRLLGWQSMDSIFLGPMLTISSTTIIIKALDELKLKSHRFAELIFAVLVVEDLFAILLLVGLTAMASSETISSLALLTAAGKLILVIGSWFIFGYFVIPRFMRYVGRIGNNEMLTLLSLGLCLGLVVFATRFNYSTALGAFIMGSILAESALLDRIQARMEPLRDLFGAIFFVSIGMLIDPRILWEHKGVIAILCALTITGKILSAGTGTLVSGQTFRNSVRVGFGLAQIGEFSFIIASLGLTLGATSDFIYPIIVAVSLVTTFVAPYLIRLSGPLAEKLEKMLPSRIKSLLNRYAVWNEERRTATGKRKGFYLRLFRWFINGLTVTVIFVLCSELLVPELRARLSTPPNLILALGWIASVIISAPFIWGMATTFKKHTPETAGQDYALSGGSLFLFRLLTLFWIAALSFEFFPARYVTLITSIVLIAILGVFYRQLESSYRWFEREFLSTFEPHEKKGHAPAMAQLAPWDAHLVRIKVHPNATFCGKNLAEVQLRNKYGLNVVAIQRGLASIVAPKPEEQLLPHDELLVLGTDEKLENARVFIEGPASSPYRLPQISGYALKHVDIKAGGRLSSGMTIRNAGIRERFGAMVVGLERAGERIMNPDSDMTLQVGDLLWLVGPTETIQQLRQEFMPPDQAAYS